MACLSRRRDRGQSTVEFGASAIVLMLILVGLLDLGRAFYFGVALRGATREAARQASWFDASNAVNPYLFDNDTTWSGDPCSDPSPGIKQVVDCNLEKSFLPASTLANPTTTCPSVSDGNSAYNPPYADAVFPSASNSPTLYICYANNPGVDLSTAPADNSRSGQDVNVILVMRFASVTGLFPDVFGNIRLVANTHMTVGGYPCPC